MSKSALKSVKVILWAEVHKSQNAKLISISLKNTKHEGNHKRFILPKRKWLHRVLERIYEEGHQLMMKFLQQPVTTDINLWNKKIQTNYIYFRRVNTSAYWSTQNRQREQKQWRQSWDIAFTMNACQGYFGWEGKGKPIQDEKCKGSPKINASQVS